MLSSHFATKQYYMALAFLWSVLASIGFYSLHGSPLDPGGMARLFVAAALGGVMLVIMIAFFTLVSKNAYTALGFLWLVFSLIATFTLDDLPNDPGVMARIATGAAMGAASMAFIFILGGLVFLFFDLLPRKIAYWRLSSIEQYAHDINARTTKGREQRRVLIARLVTEAVSHCSRQKIYYDPQSDQHWLGSYWEQDFDSGEDLRPISRMQAKAIRERFEAGERRVSS